MSDNKAKLAALKAKLAGQEPVANDDTPMPFGIHSGEKLKDVPAHYLIWAYDSGALDRFPLVKSYVGRQFDALEQEAQEQDKQERDAIYEAIDTNDELPF